MDEVGRTGLLIQRTALNYRRNILAYGIRIAMYGAYLPGFSSVVCFADVYILAGMGLLLATIWIRLEKKDTKINDRLSVS